ncbi:unnamed protein product, partial [Mesorhabditis spiculigera]
MSSKRLAYLKEEEAMEGVARSMLIEKMKARIKELEAELQKEEEIHGQLKSAYTHCQEASMKHYSNRTALPEAALPVEVCIAVLKVAADDQRCICPFDINASIQKLESRKRSHAPRSKGQNNNTVRKTPTKRSGRTRKADAHSFEAVEAAAKVDARVVEAPEEVPQSNTIIGRRIPKKTIALCKKERDRFMDEMELSSSDEEPTASSSDAAANSTEDLPTDIPHKPVAGSSDDED